MSRALTAREMIKREYGTSKNFMTPDVLRRGKLHRAVAYELSGGGGFLTSIDRLFAVSVVAYNKEMDKTARCTDVSEVFSSRAEAEDYISELRTRWAGLGDEEVVSEFFGN